MGSMLQETLWGPPEPVEVIQAEPPITDPRKDDLKYDSASWTKLLELARKKDPMLAGTLHGFRCGGLRLHRGGKGYALRPDFDPQTSIWTSVTEYEADRDKWLMPYRKEIVELLQQL